MKKNLKKVISAVIALALSVTTVATAAFTDVAETASYAQAVDTLSALGVISGYDDGTFLPENNITRAEVATMVVAALNRTADADGAKGTTRFADMNVEAKAWATGFVNIGVSEGYISGYEDGSFKPDNNVTFAEIVSMLVRVAGYGKYAEYLGGWPNGYLSVGRDKGITTGVSAAENAPVTRAQVAQMVYNTVMNVPIVESTTLTTDSNGNLVPEMTIMNGKDGNDYKTILTEKHNAYYVEGKVNSTNQSSGGTIDADQVNFLVEYTMNYNDSDIVIKKGETESVLVNNVPTTQAKVRQLTRVYVGDTAAANYIMTYAQAIIAIDDNDDATIVWFAPSGKNDIVTFDTVLVDDDDYVANNTVFTNNVMNASPYIKYFETIDANRSAKYELDPNFKIYVNGVNVPTTKAKFDQYVVNNTVGKVDLIDAYKTDGDIDYVFVTYYDTAIVDSVNVSNGRIGFKKSTSQRMNLTLDPEDDDLAYQIIYNGEEIDISALQEYDVLSIAYNVNATPIAFQDSNFYTIYVSRDTVEGKYTGKSDLDKTVTVGGKAYETVEAYNTVVADPAFKMSDEYTLYLDAFGRIFSYETLLSAEKYAILDMYSLASSAHDYNSARLFTTDGSVKTLQVDTSRVADPITEQGQNLSTDDSWKSIVYVNGSNGTKKPIQNRVVKYKVSNTTGYITSMTLVSAADNDQDEYDEYINAVGGIRLSDATNVVDAIEYVDLMGKGKIPSTSDLAAANKSSFVNKSEYTVYAYGTTNSDGSYPFVLVVDGKGTYTTETQLAVVTNYAGYGVDAEENDVYKFTALFDGVETEFEATDDADVYGFGNGATIADANLLAKGDIIAFVKTGDKVTEITRVLSASAIGVATSYDAVFANAMAGSVESAIVLPDYDYQNSLEKDWTTDWSKKGNDDAVVLTYGPIIDKTNSSFRIGTVKDSAAQGAPALVDGQGQAVAGNWYYTDVTDKTQYEDVKITDSTKVYVWDYNYAAKAQLQDADCGAGSIVKTAIGSAAMYNNQTIIPYASYANQTITKNADAATNFAFAKTVNGYATEVFVIIAK